MDEVDRRTITSVIVVLLVICAGWLIAAWIEAYLERMDQLDAADRP